MGIGDYPNYMAPNERHIHGMSERTIGNADGIQHQQPCNTYTSKDRTMSIAIESPLNVTVTINVEPIDVVRGLDHDDSKIITFVCQVLALAGSLELRQQLAERLGAIGMRPEAWDDDEFLPSHDGVEL